MPEITEVKEAIIGDDGALTLYMRTASGSKSELRLSLEAQGVILQALLGSTFDPLSPSSRHFEPLGLSRFRLNDEVGISFLLSTSLAIHFLLDRSLAATLQDFLATFDDPATWRKPKPN